MRCRVCLVAIATASIACSQKRRGDQTESSSGCIAATGAKMAYPMAQSPYRPLEQMGGGTGFAGGQPNPRDGITQALMNVNNPAPGYLSPPGVPGGPAQVPLGPMGSIGGPLIPGMNLPGITPPGQLPPTMSPQNALGGVPQRQPGRVV